MKKILTSLMVLGLVLATSTANAGIYFGGRGGFEKYKVENSDWGLDYQKTKFLAGGFLGYHSGFFRLEAEYLYHPKRSISGFSSESQTVTGNLFFSPPIKSMLHPYIMGGAGAGFHKLTVGGDEEKDTTFTWQAGIGLEVEPTDNVFFDVGGRWIDFGDPEYEKHKVDTKGYFYYLGLRFEY